MWAIMAIAFSLACFSLQPLAARAQDTRGFDPPAPSTQPGDNGNYYALVIGIDDYRPPMPRLKTAVNDARAIARLLAERYGFQVKLLLDADASHGDILDSINQYRTILGQNDSLLIYYAGHGYSDRDADKSYWLPVDARDGLSANRIIADELTADIRALPSRHVLIISDSCYSGGLSRDPGEPLPTPNTPAYLTRELHRRSRTLMSSGGDEPVSDSGADGHSVFAAAVIQALEQEDEPMFAARDVFYASVRKQVAGKSEQIPQYTSIRNSNDDNGDFIFIRKIAPTPPPITQQTARASTPNGAELYRKGYELAHAGKFADAIPLLTDACAANSGPGCNYLGWMYSNAKGVAQDHSRSVVFYRKACDSGVAGACYNLGVEYDNGTGVAQDIAQAATLYRKACEGSEPLACFNLGVDYDQGMGVSKDPSQAAALYRKACESGEMQSCTNLGMEYEYGKGVSMDPAQAVTLYRKACDGGFATACTDLGFQYDNGKGVTKDPTQAVALYRKACNGGYAAGCTNLGNEYDHGTGVAQDNAQAVTLYRKGCEGGEMRGCFDLGVHYANGTGVAQDNAQAVAFYRKACNGGELSACNNLGIKYEKGSGVSADPTQAATLYRKSCDGGDKDGCTNLKRLQP